MVWNRRATKDKQHPGKYNPREEWVMSRQPEHPAIVSVETFLAAQPKRRRERSRVDTEPLSPNPHAQTKSVYKLRSFVFCTPCQRRMHGKRSRHGTPYSYCQPRGREVPPGHPPALWVNEANLVEAVTRFFNTYVVGPDRLDLAIAAIPSAHDHQAAAHEAMVEAARREQHRLNEAMDNLLAVLERSSDPAGQLYRRVEQRIVQLEVDYAAATARLAELERDRPQPSGVNFQLLDHLPQGQVNLADLPADRLWRFLDAFNVKIYFDHATTTARLTAEIASGTIPDLVRLVGAIVADPPGHASVAPSDDDHAGGEGRSSRWCPRRDTTYNCAPDGRLAIAADLPIS